jgi:hypothetical protein
MKLKPIKGNNNFNIKIMINETNASYGLDGEKGDSPNKRSSSFRGLQNFLKGNNLVKGSSKGSS